MSKNAWMFCSSAGHSTDQSYVWTVSMLLFAVLGFWSAAVARPALVLA